MNDGWVSCRGGSRVCLGSKYLPKTFEKNLFSIRIDPKILRLETNYLTFCYNAFLKTFCPGLYFFWVRRWCMNKRVGGIECRLGDLVVK